MTSFARTLGSLVRGVSSYSNEQDPWENDVPISFQSVRRESRAKPPSSLRVPRAITIPSLLSLRSHVRNRSSNDGDPVFVSPILSRAPPKSPCSVTSVRQRIVDDHGPVEEISPAIASRSFIRRGNTTILSPSPASRSFLFKNWEGKPTTKGARKLRNDGEWGESSINEAGQTAPSAEDVPPMSPVSNDGEDEEGHLSRRKWLRGRVRRVLRLKRRERA